jgi:protein KTI12
MALIMMCGFPASGKTRRAQIIADYFRGQGKTVHLINEESLGMVRRKLYVDIPSEKNTRATFKSATERMISKDAIVCGCCA